MKKDFILKVQIEKNGVMVKAGTISGTGSADAVFSYDDEYLAYSDNRPVSISLPLSKKNFSAEQTRNYFEGLLPEGFTRKSIADSIHADSDDYISILHELGKECLGAIQIIDEKENCQESGYKELSEKEVKALAEEGVSLSTALIIESHLSLTGASGKTGLYFDEKSKKWYQPLGASPSNYIVKQSHVRLGSIIVNEQLCLLTAKKIGIEVPESFILQTDIKKTGDADILFATKRFDRYTDLNSKVINGLSVPYRLHQEDFAQALGIKSAEKYEKNSEHYLKKMFEILRSWSVNPIEDQLKLWKICVFNYFIGNTDNHIKNYSLIYSKDLRSIRLAPCYDVVSTRIYKKDMDEMSLSINGKLKISEITRQDFELEARAIGLGVKSAMKIFDDVRNSLEVAMKESAVELTKKGFQEAEEISRKIIAELNV